MLIGRKSEREQLDEYLRSALDGKGRVVAVRGEAGIGKTALVQDWWASTTLRNTGEKAHILFGAAACSTIPTAAATGRALEALQPFAELLQSLGLMLQAEASGKSGMGRMILKIAPKWLAAVPFFGDVVWAGLETYEIIRERNDLMKEAEADKASQQQIFQQYVNFLSRLSERKEVSGLVLFLDDFHWADAASVNLLFYFARQIAGKRILVIVAFRPDAVVSGTDTDEHPVQTMHRELVRSQLAADVHLLSSDANWTREFFGVNHARVKLTDEFINWATEISGGNPLFLKSLVQQLSEEQQISEDGTVRASFREVGVASAIREALEDRLRNLGAEARKLLQFASVQGEVFTSSVLARMSDLPLLHVLELLRECEHASVIRLVNEPTDTPGRRTHFRFVHSEFRRVLYNSLTGEERNILHAVCFNLYREENSGGGTLGANDLEALLYHGEVCGEFSKIAELALGAARRAWADSNEKLAVSYLGKATAWFERAQAVEHHSVDLEFPNSLESELLAMRAAMQKHAGNYTSALRLYEQVRSTNERERNYFAAIDAEIEIAWIQWRLAKYGESGATSRHCLETVAAHPYPHGEAMARRVLGLSELFLGNTHTALNHFENSLELLHGNAEPHAMAIVLVDQAAAYCMIGANEKAENAVQHALTLCETTDNQVDRALALSILGFLLASDGDFVRARSYFERCLAFFESVHDVSRQAFTLTNIAALEARSGNAGTAEKYFREALRIFDRIEDGLNQAHVLRQIGVLSFANSELETAREQMNTSLVLFQIHNHLRGAASCLHYLGEISHQEGNYSEARDFFLKSMSIYEELGDTGLIAATCVYLARTERELNERKSSAASFERVLSLGSNGECDDRWTADAYEGLGFLLEQANKLGGANDFYEAGLIVRRGTKDVAGEAQSLIQVGHIRRLRGEFDAAETALLNGYSIARQSGYLVAANAAHDELQLTIQSERTIERNSEVERAIASAPPLALSTLLPKWELRTEKYFVSIR